MAVGHGAMVRDKITGHARFGGAVSCSHSGARNAVGRFASLGALKTWIGDMEHMTLGAKHEGA